MHSCSICKKNLIGIDNKGSKTQNRPGRKMPGLCVKCSERVFRLAKRLKKGELKQHEVEIRYLPYVLRVNN